MNNPLVQPDPGLYIWTIVTFLSCWRCSRSFAWRPLLDALERRQEAIRKSLDEAQAGERRSWAAERGVGAPPRGGAGRGRRDHLAHQGRRRPVPATR